MSAPGGPLLRRLQPNKALELTGRRSGACQGCQPLAARAGVASTGGRRMDPGSFTGGRQLSAQPLGGEV